MTKKRSLLKNKHFQDKSEMFVMFARSSADPSFNPLYCLRYFTSFTSLYT